MSDAPKNEKLPISRVVLGLGFFLLFVAVGIGAAMKDATDLPKYLASAAAVAIAVGGIWGMLQGRLGKPN